MIYGIERTTDLRSPETQVKTFTSEKTALKWASKPRELAFQGAANNDLPMDARNHHHRIRNVYRMPSGWRKPSKREIDKELWQSRGSSYHRGTAEVIAEAITRDGVQLS